MATENLSKRYGHAHALDGLNLTLEQGQVHGFLGPNGAAKSTTLRILLGLAQSTSGRATVFGLDPCKDASEVHRPGCPFCRRILRSGAVEEVIQLGSFNFFLNLSSFCRTLKRSALDTAL